MDLCKGLLESKHDIWWLTPELEIQESKAKSPCFFSFSYRSCTPLFPYSFRKPLLSAQVCTIQCVCVRHYMNIRRWGLFDWLPYLSISIQTHLIFSQFKQTKNKTNQTIISDKISSVMYNFWSCLFSPVFPLYIWNSWKLLSTFPAAVPSLEFTSHTFIHFLSLLPDSILSFHETTYQGPDFLVARIQWTLFSSLFY